MPKFRQQWIPPPVNKKIEDEKYFYNISSNEADKKLTNGKNVIIKLIVITIYP